MNTQVEGRTRDTVVVGFDLGHGETALAVARAYGTATPGVLDLPGSTRRQVVTAVAELEGHGVLIGEAALTAAGVRYLATEFKSEDMKEAQVRRPVILFVSKIVEEVRTRGLIPLDRPPLWVFGVPSGWSDAVRRRYAELLEEAVQGDVEIVRESRAAMLYARDSGEAAPAAGRLSGQVMIADLGHLTCDYTYIADYAGSSPKDHGNPALGAALIDEAIRAYVVEHHQDRDRINDILLRDPTELRRLRVLCRRAKETFFRTPEATLRLNPRARAGEMGLITDPDSAEEIIVNARLSTDEMNTVLDSPLTALAGRSWREAFRTDLSEALDRLDGPPDVLLLTGGPSRMPFVLDIARELAGADRVVLGTEPEFVISRGLALAGRMGIQAAGFRADVSELAESGRIASLVEHRMGRLTGLLGAAVARGITERHVIPAFVQWRNSDIQTLNEVVRKIAVDVNAEVTSSTDSRLAAAMAAWQNDLAPEVDELTRPICHRWGLEPGSLRLPHVSVGPGGAIGIDVNTAAATRTLSAISTVVSVVLAGVISTTLFGAGMAVLATTGPFAVIVAFVGALGLMFMGKEWLEHQLMTVSLPKPLRRMKSEAGLISRLRGDAQILEEKLARSLAAQFLADSGEKLTDETARGFAQQLDSLADEAELLLS
ncbi:Hsp70 family protein [Streptomyces sp. NBC_00658]|uniref:Hsp70 family protein n=1 Tax=Streptomyces sp. NBC_00658 TaxID=2975800 RepID=UPI00324A4D0B